MAKEFWEDDAPAEASVPAESGGDFWLSDKPAAQQDLPAGVTPSTAGAGRGNAGLADYRAKEVAQTAAPARAAWEDHADQLMADTAAPAAKKVSVLEGVQLQPEKPWSFREASEARRAIDDMPVRRGESIATPVPNAAGIGMDIRDSIKNPAARGVVAGFTGLGQVLPGAVEAAADFVGAEGVADVAARTARTGRQIAAPLQPKAGNDKLVFDIANSITQTAPTLIMGLGGGPAMTALFGQSAAQEYSQGRSAGLDGGTAAARAGVMAGAEVLGERFGFGEQIKILKGLTARIPAEELAPIFARQIMKEIPGEQLTTLVQFLGDKYGPGAQNPEAALSDYLQQAGDTLKVTIGQTAVMGGGPVAISEARKQFARPVDRTPQIEALRKTGDETAAALLERRQNTEMAAFTTERETEALANFGPDLQQRYRDTRLAGAKTGDAVVQTAARWNFDQAAQLAGLSPKAQEAISNKLAEVPAEKAAGFVQKAITGLVNAGQAQPFDDLDTLAQTIETQRDQMLDSVLATMADIESLEQQDAPQEAAPAAVDTAAAEAPGLGGAGVDGVDQPGAVPALSAEWQQFPEQTGTLNVPRAEMPQVKTAHRGPLTNFLNARGVTHEQVEVDPAELKPTQAEFSQTKVQEAADRDTDRSILISADGHIIDGHHQAIAKLQNGKPVRAIRLNATAEELIPLVHEFPSSTTEQANVQNAAPGTEAQAATAPVEAPATAGSNAAAAAGLPGTGRGSDAQADGVNLSENEQILNTFAERAQETLKTAQVELLGQNSQLLSEGGKPFKTELAARKEKKLHPDKRVVKSPDGKGFILKPMSAKQIAAQEAAARRIRGADTGDKGPLSAHGFILARGGLAKSSMSDAGFDKNVRIGNRWLFTDSGKTLAQAGQDLKEAGFITDETENAASDIIRRSIASPQYTAEGWEAVAEAEAQTRFEDHLKAQQESEEDPFASLADDGYTAEDTEGTGFDQASPEIQAEVAALSAQLESMGEDSESILERVALQYPDATQQEYHEHVKAAITAAVAEAAQPAGRGDPGQDDGEQGQAREGTGESLTDRPDGTLSVKGDTQALRERLTAAGIPAKSILPSATGVVVGRTQAQKARDLLEPAEQSAYSPTIQDTKTRRSLALQELGDDWTAEKGIEGAKDLFKRTAKLQDGGRLEMSIMPQRTTDGNFYVGSYQKGGIRKGTGSNDSSAKTLAEAKAIADAMLQKQVDYLTLGDRRKERRERLTGQDRWQYSTPLKGQPENQTKAMRQVVDYMNGDITRTALLDHLEKSGLQEGVMFSITQRLEDDAPNFGEMAAMLKRREDAALKSPTRADIEAQQERVSRADELDARAQVKRESEAGADSFTLTVEDGRQDTTQPMFSRSADPLAILSETDDLYSMPKSGKDTIEGITADHDSEIKVRKTDLPGNETMYTLTMPDGTPARITVRKSGPRSVYGAETDADNNTTWETGRPGENPEDVPDDMEDVWIDVSNLKPGQNGARVYNIAATFAHNTGRMFIGDPAGLSDEAMRRRAEHMLSSALKFGTTRHLAPHPRQTDGATGLGIPALKWVYGDDVGNIQRLAELNVKALDSVFPEASAITYDPATGTFSTELAERLNPSDVRDLFSRGTLADRQGSGRRAARAGAGWRTLARGAVFRSLLRGRGTGGDGAGRSGAGESLLDQLVRQRAQLASATKDGRIFYSRPLTAELFRQMTTPMQRGMKTADLQKAIAPVLNRWQNGPNVTVVATTKDLPMPAPGDVHGVYFGGKVYLVAQNIRDKAKAMEVLTHEAIAHHGLREMLGKDDWKKFMGNIQLALKTGNKPLAAIRKDVRAAYVDDAGKFNLSEMQEADEIAAKVVEQAVDADGNFRPGFGFVKSVYAKVVEFLRSIGIDVKMTHAELQGALVNAQRFLEVGKKAGSAREAKEPVFSRTAKAPASIEAEKAAGAAKPAQAEMFQPGFWDAPQETRLDKVIFELQDGRIDLRRVQEAITKANTIPEKFDARMQETLYPGRVATRAKQFLDDEAKPLLDAMARNNVTMDELADYLHARHAEERNKQIAKVNPDLPDGGAGKNSKGVLMTTEAAKQHIAALSEGKRMVLTAMAKRVDAITQGTTKLLVDEGLEKQETIDAWTGAYKSYVPLFRDEAENGNPHPTGSGMSVRGGSSKRAVGSTKQATNILAHVLMQREAAITRAEKNRVAVALYGLALTNPNPDFWTTIKPGMSPEAIGRELQRMGVDPTVAEAGMMGVPTIKTVDPTLGRVVSRPNPMYKSLPGAIVLKVNGEDRVLMVNVNDPRGLRMAENLKNMDGLTKFDIAGSIVGKTTRWLASVNTQYNPAFGLVNLTRDTLGGAINLSSTKLRGKTLKVLAMTPGALKGIGMELSGKKSGEWGRLFRQFQQDGGQTGYREMFKDANDRAKALEAELKAMEKAGKLTTDKVAGKVLGALDIFNTTLENAVRLAAYREALQEGMSRPEAARLGRELTVDFNRKGRMGRELGPLYAFFNASVQGSARTLQTLAGPDGAKIIAGGVSLGVLQAVMLLAAGYDDDEIPEFVKSRALIIPLGTDDEGKKRYFTIPLPLGLHVLPNTGRVLAELTMDGGKDALTKGFEAAGEIAGAFNPLGGGSMIKFNQNGQIEVVNSVLKNLSPTVTDWSLELTWNQNFAGTAIEREGYGNDPRPGFERAREGTLRAPTGQAYLEISRILNKVSGGDEYEAGRVSPTPEMVRYLAQVVGGGLLREIEKTVNTSIAMSKGEDAKPTGLPVFGRFYGEVDDASVQRSRYYDNLTAIEKAEKLIRAAEKKGDLDAADRIEADKPEAMLKKEKNRAVKDLRELNKEAMETVGDSEAIKALDEERTAVMRELNDAAREIDAPRRDATLGAKLRKSLAAAP